MRVGRLDSGRGVATEDDGDEWRLTIGSGQLIARKEKDQVRKESRDVNLDRTWRRYDSGYVEAKKGWRREE